MKLLFSTWNDVGISAAERYDFSFYTHTQSAHAEFMYSDLKKEHLESYPNSIIFNYFDWYEFLVIDRNKDLLNLIFLGVISDKYPFKIKSNTTLFKEIQIYNIKVISIIAEISAGAGEFSIFHYSLFPKTTIYINEIDTKLVEHINLKINVYKNAYQVGNISTVIGKSRKCKLEGKNLDKIIIRNSFHHFKYPKSMLKSIRKSMNKNGELFILEKLKDDLNEHDCNKSLERNKIISLLEIKLYHYYNLLVSN